MALILCPVCGLLLPVLVGRLVTRVQMILGKCFGESSENERAADRA